MVVNSETKCMHTTGYVPMLRTLYLFNERHWRCQTLGAPVHVIVLIAMHILFCFLPTQSSLTSFWHSFTGLVQLTFSFPSWFHTTALIRFIAFSRKLHSAFCFFVGYFSCKFAKLLSNNPVFAHRVDSMATDQLVFKNFTEEPGPWCNALRTSLRKSHMWLLILILNPGCSVVQVSGFEVVLDGFMV